MPTKIAQIDLTLPLSTIGPLRGYDRVWILVKHGRRPLGWLKCARSMAGSAITPEMLGQLIWQQMGIKVWQSLAAGPLAKPAGGPGISVVICTRDHPAQLRRQLESVGKLVYHDYEVIVVDNAPRDEGTRRVCGEFPFVRYILEREPGLDYARNAGWHAATRPVVAYTDDDACVDLWWLAAIGEAYNDPAVQCVTGLTLPMELETAAQEYFEAYGGMQRGFGRRVYRPATWNTYYPLGCGRMGAGVNLSVRRSMLERLGGFDVALDVGSLARGGGDLDMMARVLREGGTLVYEPMAMVWHQHRREMRQLQRQMFDYGYGCFAFLAKYARRDLILGNHATNQMRKWFWIWSVKRFVRNLGDVLRARPHYPLSLIVREALGFVLGIPAYGRSLARVESRNCYRGLEHKALSQAARHGPVLPPEPPAWSEPLPSYSWTGVKRRMRSRLPGHIGAGAAGRDGHPPGEERKSSKATADDRPPGARREVV